MIPSPRQLAAAYLLAGLPRLSAEAAVGLPRGTLRNYRTDTLKRRWDALRGERLPLVAAVRCSCGGLVRELPCLACYVRGRQPEYSENRYGAASGTESRRVWRVPHGGRKVHSDVD